MHLPGIGEALAKRQVLLLSGRRIICCVCKRQY